MYRGQGAPCPQPCESAHAHHATFARGGDRGDEALEDDEVEPGSGSAKSPVPVGEAVGPAAPKRELAELPHSQRGGLCPLLSIRVVTVAMVIIVPDLPATVRGVGESTKKGSAQSVGSPACEV